MSGPEKKFVWLWKALNGPDLAMEHVFHPTRKWRFDFCCEKYHISDHPRGQTARWFRVAIEIEGAVWAHLKAPGRHNRASGFEADAVKYMEANLLGWTVFRLTEKMITTPNLDRIIKFIQNGGPP